MRSLFQTRAIVRVSLRPQFAVYALVPLISAFSSPVAGVEQLVYSGAYTFVIPRAMSNKMTEFASSEKWIFFPSQTRRIDTDDDGKPDFIAIGLGAAGGYGAQVRYRLTYRTSDGSPQLGSWYWCVLTDETGEQVFEVYRQ